MHPRGEIPHDASPTAEVLQGEVADLSGFVRKEASHRIRKRRPDRRQRLRHRQVVRDHGPPGHAALQQRRRLHINQRQITLDRGRRPREPAGNLGTEPQPVLQMLPRLQPGRPTPQPAIQNPAQEHKQTLDRNPDGVMHVEIGRPIRDHLADLDVICIAGVRVCVVPVVISVASFGCLAWEQRYERDTI